MPVYIQVKSLLQQCSGPDDSSESKVCQQLQHQRQATASSIESAKQVIMNSGNGQEQPKHSLLEMSTLQSSFINDTMKHIRQKELEDQAAVKKQKRQKTMGTSSSPAADQIKKVGCKGSRDDHFLDRLSTNPNFGQIVATSGGLVTYCKFSVCTTY